MMSATTFSTEISPVEVLAVKVGAIEVFPTETTLIESSTCINATTHANLPETLKKFCLLEKVVVITGCVSHYQASYYLRSTDYLSMLVQRCPWPRQEHC